METEEFLAEMTEEEYEEMADRCEDCSIREHWGYCHCDYIGHDRDES